MKYMSAFWQKLPLVLLALFGLGVVWATSRPNLAQGGPADANQERAMRLLSHRSIRDGVGSKFKFSHANKTTADAKASVNSVAQYITERSDEQLNQDTLARLTELESRTYRGELSRIRALQLVDILTDVALDRLSTLSDQDIDHAKDVLSRGGAVVYVRPSSGIFSTSEEFVNELKSARDRSRSGDPALKEMLRSSIRQDVIERLTLLSGALPEQFGSTGVEGLTPAQAFLVVYSVIADDPLAGSMDEGSRESARGASPAQEPSSSKEFGVHGRLAATPLDLCFNDDVVRNLLSHMEKEGNRK